MTPENRIPELDLARGFCVIGMIIVHLIYDLTELYPILGAYPPLFLFVKDWGGIAFFLISGISVTLGHRHLRRGIIVLGCGMLVSAVTAVSGFMPVRFGVLHALGVCMLSWEGFKRFSPSVLAGSGIVIAVLGQLFAQATVPVPFLYPLGLIAAGFESADFFPLFPYLGYFLLGACVGRLCYAARRSLLPQFPFTSPFSSFLRFCGRHALLLYLIHQPVLILIIETAVFTGGIFHEI